VARGVTSRVQVKTQCQKEKKTFKQPGYLRNAKKYLPRYLPLGVCTFLPTGLLRFGSIFSKFREISQTC